MSAKRNQNWLVWHRSPRGNRYPVRTGFAGPQMFVIARTESEALESAREKTKATIYGQCPLEVATK